MKISLIVAMASNRAIGINGKMPWRLPADLKHFKKLTMGSAVLMGRKTFEAIGHPLPGRENIIITRNSGYRQPDCLVFTDLISALRHCATRPEIFVIGGASLYQDLLSQAHFLYLTEIHKNFTGDTFFPEFNRQDWLELEKRQIDDDPTVDYAYTFSKYARKNINI
ncbi:MAG: dihydrofolate reductase [Methylomonas sp.]|jgi:dihydrofolate reductase